jgi:transposase
MKQSPADLRERLLGAIDAGLPLAAAGRLVGVCPSTIRRLRQRQRMTGSVMARPRPGPASRIGGKQAATVQAQVAAAPDATLAVHCAVWEQQQGVRVSVATMSRVIRRLRSTLKKSPVRQGAE